MAKCPRGCVPAGGLSAAMGDCYAWAAKFCLGKQGCVVRHGTVEHPWSHKRYAHAWAEYRGSAWDYQTDTMGRQPVPLAEFDAQYHPQVEATYVGGHAFRQGTKTGHWGPFHGLAAFPDARAASKLTLTDAHINHAKSNKGVAIIWMSPRDFLSLTTMADDNNWREEISFRPIQPIEAYNQYIAEGENIIMPRLDVELGTGKVTGHEGRHRAAAVMNAGGAVLPVSIHLRDPETYAIKYYDESRDAGGWTKTFHGFDQIPRVLLPQDWGPKAPNRTRPVVLTDAAFADGVELWK